MMPLIFGDEKSLQMRDAHPNARNRQMRLPMPTFTGERHVMSEREIVAALALHGCKFLPASWDKRFARDLAEAAKAKGELTDRQTFHLWRLVHRYRRQIKDPNLVQEAVRRCAGD